MEKSFGKRKKSNDFPFPNWKKSSVFPRPRFLTIWKNSNIIENFRIGKSRAIIEIFRK